MEFFDAISIRPYSSFGLIGVVVPLVGLVLKIAFIALITIAIIHLLKKSGLKHAIKEHFNSFHRGFGGHHHGHHHHDAKDILKTRYAKGEITDEEFDRMLSKLEEADEYEEEHGCCGGHNSEHKCCGRHGHHHEGNHKCCGGHGHHHEEEGEE